MTKRYCPVSGKRCFASVRQARRLCARVSNRLRVYFCRGCGGFHISDADAEPSARKRMGRDGGAG